VRADAPAGTSSQQAHHAWCDSEPTGFDPDSPWGIHESDAGGVSGLGCSVAWLPPVTTMAGSPALLPLVGFWE